MGDVYLTHDQENLQESVSRQALRDQSKVLGGWLVDATGDRIALNDITRAEFDALVVYVRSTDVLLAQRATLRGGSAFLTSKTPIYDDVLSTHVEHLVRPAHKYDCPLLWNKIVCAIGRQPTTSAVAAMNSLTDVAPAEWVSHEVAMFCYRRARLPRRIAPDVDSWSDALCAAAFRAMTDATLAECAAPAANQG
jgi:hypothetical protein